MAGNVKECALYRFEMLTFVKGLWKIGSESALRWVM